MLVICAAVGEPADRRRAAADLNLLARELQIGAGVSFFWEETKRRAAKALCSAALTGKVVQGVPIVGVYGGFRNGVLLRQIGSMAAVKYQQRLLSYLAGPSWAGTRFVKNTIFDGPSIVSSQMRTAYSIQDESKTTTKIICIGSRRKPAPLFLRLF